MMSKRLFAVLMAGALVASVFSAMPAQAAPEVPATPNIVDPAGDGNYIHDGHDSRVPSIGRNYVTPAGSINGTGDIVGVWFSHDAQSIRVHVHTAISPPSGWGLNYTVYASPGEGEKGSSSLGCLRFTTLMPGSNAGGGTYQGKPIVNLHDRCNVGGSFFSASTPGEFVVEKLEDGSGVTTSTWPRSASPLLADAAVVTAPYAIAAPYTTGADAVGFLSVPIDNTDVGTDYTIGGGAPATEEPPAEEPPAEEPEDKCAKKKGKAKKKCEKKQQGSSGAACPAYGPGEMGAEAETTLVTDAATEEAPIEIEIPIGEAGGSYAPAPVDLTSRVKHNVQVDSKNPEAGLFVKLESPVTDDPDLYAYWDNGKEAARAAGFNQALFAGPLPGGLLSGTGNGGHSGFGYEQIDGLRTADCGGWTLDLVNWLGQGGTYKLKLWVGEIQNDPKPRE